MDKGIVFKSAWCNVLVINPLNSICWNRAQPASKFSFSNSWLLTFEFAFRKRKSRQKSDDDLWYFCFLFGFQYCETQNEEEKNFSPSDVMVYVKLRLSPKSQFCIWHFGFCLQSKYLLHLVLRDAKYAINTIFMIK